jgi:hypothetical protein
MENKCTSKINPNNLRVVAIWDGLQKIMDSNFYGHKNKIWDVESSLLKKLREVIEPLMKSLGVVRGGRLELSVSSSPKGKDELRRVEESWFRYIVVLRRRRRAEVEADSAIYVRLATQEKKKVGSVKC